MTAHHHWQAPISADQIPGQVNLHQIVTAALDEDRVGLAYQPVVRAGAQGFVAFHEGLLRLRLPDGQIWRAGQFVPQLEHDALGRALDRRALELALRLLCADPGLRISVNISGRSLGDRPWLDILAHVSRHCPGAVHRLIIEITETAAIHNPDAARAFMAQARALGCAFAIDDFGAGHTSFSHFRQFRCDIVKIDGQFIRGLHQNPDNQVLVEVLVRIARHFDMMCVAECVETAEEAAAATALGVDALQGYHFGRASERPICLHGPPDSQRALA